jgi:hypothetical protein
VSHAFWWGMLIGATALIALVTLFSVLAIRRNRRR